MNEKTNEGVTTIPSWTSKVNIPRTEEIISGILTWKNIDCFLENPPKQPKKEIADYVEQNGILVPKRFANLQEALKFVEDGWEVIIRSEHPDEYNGISGLLESYILNKRIIEEWKVCCKENGKIIDKKKLGNEIGQMKRAQIIQQIFWQVFDFNQEEFEEYLKLLSKIWYTEYSRLMGINQEEFENNISYSYWEKKKWYNRSIIADSSIKWRYHIFTSDATLHHDNYMIVDNWKIIQNLPQDLNYNLQNKVNDVINFYEKIRHLNRFDSTHCPIIEFQTDDFLENYFLQYHRTRQEELTTGFTLDRPLEEWEIEANFVRWATLKEWIIVNTAMYFSWNDYKVLKNEEWAFDYHYNNIFSEIMTRRREINFLENDAINISRKVWSHLVKSELFNSKITISISDCEMLKLLYDYLFNQFFKNNKIIRIPIRVISDWRKAYVKFIIDGLDFNL